jgi:hypothetical protein
MFAYTLVQEGPSQQVWRAFGLRMEEVVSRNGGCLQVILTKHLLKADKRYGDCDWGSESPP